MYPFSQNFSTRTVSLIPFYFLITNLHQLNITHTKKQRICKTRSPYRTKESFMTAARNSSFSVKLFATSGKDLSCKFLFITGRLAVIVFGLFTLAMGIILSSIPWLDYIILKVSLLQHCISI